MKSVYTIAACLLYFVIPLGAQDESANKSFSKSITVGRETKLEVINRYGDINISTWDKDSAYITAEIEAYAPDRTRLDKLIAGINVSITGTGSLVRAETVFERETTVLLESFKEFTGKLIDYESRVRINYFINIPDYVDIDIKNQFGDISAEDNTGTVSIDLSNGDFRANTLNRVSALNLDFGDAVIGSVRSAKIITSFSKIKIDRSDELDLSSTSSRFDLGKAGIVEFESRKDKFFIGEVSTITGVSWFTDYSIEYLVTAADIDLKFGSFDIERINGRFDNMVIKSANADIKANFEPSASYDYEIRQVNAFVVLPDNKTRAEKETVNENRKEYLLTGKIGTSTGRSRLKIDATRGNVYVR
ncbi:MAG TPA: hypothetical protein DCY25_11530 [Bacteroidales bacterium]|nr:hypothetical protein [Bacteroidales bacterium]